MRRVSLLLLVVLTLPLSGSASLLYTCSADAQTRRSCCCDEPVEDSGCPLQQKSDGCCDIDVESEMGDALRSSSPSPALSVQVLVCAPLILDLGSAASVLHHSVAMSARFDSEPPLYALKSSYLL
jgi:hypothetical protein